MQTELKGDNEFDDDNEDFEDKNAPTTLLEVENDNSESSDCHMTFDGQHLKLYNKGQQIDDLDAMSGHSDYQQAQYQNIENKGPIPEGTYWVNQDQRQELTLKELAQKASETLGINDNYKRNWSGNPVSWGIRRVWLDPDDDTDTYGRSGFSIHGGLMKGSAGCIDIPWQTHRLKNYLNNCQFSTPLYVRYPRRRW